MRILSVLKDFNQELRRRNQFFYILGMILTALFVFFLLSFAYCQHSIAEICHWLKPCKFTISFALYVFTLGWYMEYLKSTAGESKIRFLTRLIGSLVIVETSIIFIQSWLVSDNYIRINMAANTTEWLSRGLYHLGNAVIVADTFVASFVAMLFFRKIPLTPESYLYGIRTAFVVFILSGFLGAFLIYRYGQLSPDTSSLGIPFTRFSTTRDNLISLHFLGIHFLQVLPFLCFYFQKYLGKQEIMSLAVAYASVCLIFISKALR